MGQAVSQAHLFLKADIQAHPDEISALLIGVLVRHIKGVCVVQLDRLHMVDITALIHHIIISQVQLDLVRKIIYKASTNSVG